MDIYVCSACGHLAFSSVPDKCPVCGAPASSFKHNNDIFIESKEQYAEAEGKHSPSVTVKKECKLIPEESCTDVIIRIGSTLHPMKSDHYIKWIDVYLDDTLISHISLTPSVQPAACVHLKGSGTSLRVVEHCTVHGYWMARQDI